MKNKTSAWNTTAAEFRLPKNERHLYENSPGEQSDDGCVIFCASF